MAPKAKQSHKLLGGKLTVFPRSTSQFWWCGFYHGKQHIRASTGSADLKSAKKFAETWFIDKQVELRGVAPVAPKAKSFETAATKAIATYQAAVNRGDRSAAYLKALAIVIEKQLVPVIGTEALASINQATWNRYQEQMFKKRSYSPATIHQHKNAIQIVLKEAVRRGELPAVPRFVDDLKSKSATPRTWFTDKEYERLVEALIQNIDALKDTRWHDAARELRDYCEIVANSGLRVGEAMALRFCDIEILKEYDNSTDEVRPYLLFKNIKGKRGTGVAKSFYGALLPFLRRQKERNVADPNSAEPVFLEYHRDMFRKVLDTAKLRVTNDRPPRKRDLMSLRHTYICFRLLQGVPVHDVAANCRTSVAMIEQHYAKWLSPAQSTSINRSATSVHDVKDEEDAGLLQGTARILRPKK